MTYSTPELLFVGAAKGLVLGSNSGDGECYWIPKLDHLELVSREDPQFQSATSSRAFDVKDKHTTMAYATPELLHIDAVKGWFSSVARCSRELSAARSMTTSDSPGLHGTILRSRQARHLVQKI